MKNHEWDAKKIAYLGVFCAIAILFGYVETLLPVFTAVPGVKLGLANLVVVFLLYRWSWREAMLVSGARIAVIGFLFGNLFSILFSLAGALLSLLVMALLKRLRFHLVTVSICGGVAHNIGQIIVAAFLVQNGKLLYYLPVLMVSGVVTGAVMGILANAVERRLPNRMTGL